MLLDVQRATAWSCSVSNWSFNPELPSSHQWATINHSVEGCRSLVRGRTNRIVGRACASCCDAYRSWRYPSLSGC